MEDLTLELKYARCGYDELDDTLRGLCDAAKAATAGSYSPYSGFSVGAAVLLENGTVITGSNQENVAYPSGLCAERNALFAAGHRYPDIPVAALAVAALSNGQFTEQPVTPCGACRQVLSETARRYGRSVKVVLYGRSGCIVIENGADVLLPFSFDF